MVRRRDCPTYPLGGANAPVLRESSRSLNGRSICACGGVDVVGASIGSDGTSVSETRRGWIVGAIGFKNVVLNERVGCPAVHREVGVAGWRERARVGNNPQRLSAIEKLRA